MDKNENNRNIPQYKSNVGEITFLADVRMTEINLRLSVRVIKTVTILCFPPLHTLGQSLYNTSFRESL